MTTTVQDPKSKVQSARTFGTLRLSDDYREWCLEAEPHVMMFARRVFPGMKRSTRISATPAHCADLEWFMQRFPLEVEKRSVLEAKASAHRETRARLDQVMLGDYEPRALDLAVPLRDYQQTAVEVLLGKGGLLVADELGLGKSAIGIGTLVTEGALPAVVVCPVHLQRQWALDEFDKFAPDLSVHIARKGTPYDLPAGTDVLVMTYHKLGGWQDVLSAWARTIIFDECQDLRRRDSLKYAAAETIAHRCRYRLGLSATPIYNYGDEMWNVLNVLCPGALGARGEFLQEWCWTERRYGGAEVTDPEAFGTYLREHYLMLRRTRADVGRELPEVIRVPHTIESDARELHKIQDSAAELARIILRRAEATQQQRYVSAGQFEMIMRQATGIAKAPYVADFVQLLLETEERVILAGWHREVYGIWRGRLHDVGVAYYTGTESPAAKARSVERFRDGDARVLFLSLRSGAGLEGLQEICNVIVFGELDWSPGVHEQCIGRIHRDGQRDVPVAYYLIAEDGADPVIADVLGVKREQAAGIADPDAPLIEKLASGGPRVKALAEAFLDNGQ